MDIVYSFKRQLRPRRELLHHHRVEPQDRTRGDQNRWFNPFPPDQFIGFGATVENQGLETLREARVYSCILRATPVERCTASDNDYETVVPPLAEGGVTGIQEPDRDQYTPIYRGKCYTTVCVEPAAGETFAADNCSVGHQWIAVGVNVADSAKNTGFGQVSLRAPEPATYRPAW